MPSSDVSLENMRTYTVLEELPLVRVVQRELAGQDLDPQFVAAVVDALEEAGDRVVYDKLSKLEARNAAQAMRSVARAGIESGTAEQLELVAVSEKGWQQAPVTINRRATVTVG